jgi:hypothetical protein
MVRELGDDRFSSGGVSRGLALQEVICEQRTQGDPDVSRSVLLLLDDLPELPFDGAPARLATIDLVRQVGLPRIRQLV